MNADHLEIVVQHKLTSGTLVLPSLRRVIAEMHVGSYQLEPFVKRPEWFVVGLLLLGHFESSELKSIGHKGLELIRS